MPSLDLSGKQANKSGADHNSPAPLFIGEAGYAAWMGAVTYLNRKSVTSSRDGR